MKMSPYLVAVATEVFLRLRVYPTQANFQAGGAEAKSRKRDCIRYGCKQINPKARACFSST